MILTHTSNIVVVLSGFPIGVRALTLLNLKVLAKHQQCAYQGATDSNSAPRLLPLSVFWHPPHRQAEGDAGL